MKKEMMNILIKDRASGKILSQYPLDQGDKAYEEAASFEEFGLEVEIIQPTLTDTLGVELGRSSQEIQEFKESLEHEMDQHEGSCCFKNDFNCPIRMVLEQYFDREKS